jgi:hypothetical protein
MQALREQRDRVSAFLFSAAGNDVIGEDENHKPVLEKLILRFEPSRDAASHINRDELNKILKFLKESYQTVIDTIRAEPGFDRLPIIIHGYDYPFAYPYTDSTIDPRAPSYAAKDEWLGSAFAARDVADSSLRREILILLIDALYDMLKSLAGDSRTTHVHVVDVRGTLTSVGDWNDEIHGTDDGFARVADKFRETLRAAI